ncbi:MAG: hypothetical protein RJA07_1195 [Bacteroidota bacterium]|jgi:DNA-binding beta-propeller fold protein YncE
MRINHCPLFVCIILSIAIISCKKDKPSQAISNPITIADNGVYVINEGNFQFGNSSITYYDANAKAVTPDLFLPANNRPLGDVCQSMNRFNNNYYIVVNNSAKIEVVNANTFIAIATITGFTSPRYMLPISNNKAYVTDLYANKIAIIDLNLNAIIGSIPCHGWTEDMLLAYGKVFVTHPTSNTIDVINTITDAIQDSITIGYASNTIKEDKNGKLWVSCSGDMAKNKLASLHRINPITDKVEQSYTFANATDKCWRLCFNATNDTLYFLNKDIFRMNIQSTSLPITPFISQHTNNFYGLSIQPSTNYIYIADAIDYTQKGNIYIYNTNATLLNTFKVGIIPSSFYFK